MEVFLINNRICPQPQKWNKVREIIKSKTDERVALPLILAAWWETTDEEKLERFKYQLEFAERLNVLSEVQIYLQSLSESDWHHKGE
ncbi:MAG: hypothetical protein JXB49_30085 [Bacteroidales bacterium]|nr:hypothetical protein [Bacteroidales bacterium]